MKFYLLNMKVNGIKNIDKEVKLEFYKTVVDQTLDYSKYNVKAIYGPNGAGKTGLIYAADIYRGLVFDEKYITLSNANGFLPNIVNQNVKQLSISMCFAKLSDDNIVQNIFEHYFCLKAVNGEYKLAEERLSKLNGFMLNAEEKYKVIYQIKDGEINQIFDKCKYVDELKASTMNLLSTQSLLAAFFYTHKDSNDIKIDSKLLEIFTTLLDFVTDTTVVLQETDNNYINFANIKAQIDTLNMQMKTKDINTFKDLLRRNRIPRTNARRIKKENIASQEKYVKNLCKFIMAFKHDLQNIELKKDENGDFYEYEYILIYKDGKKINEKYESTGIKKIINIFSALCEVNNGNIVFIDEFDANIHDVLLIKIVEYVKKYALGQLIFTTHNSGPMDVLKKEKKAIDFLSTDSRISSWTNSGNYSASSQYRKGLIEFSPFNLEAFNFLGVFGDAEQ